MHSCCWAAGDSVPARSPIRAVPDQPARPMPAGQRLHQEMGCSHPRLDCPEGMLDRLAPLAHFSRVLVEPALDGFENMLILPARDPSLLAGGAAVLDGTGEYRLWPGERWLAPDATLAVLEGISAHGLHHEHDAGQRRKPI